MLLDLPQNVLQQTLQFLIDCKNVKFVLKLRACCFQSNEIVLDARLKLRGFASDRCLIQRLADGSDDQSSKWYDFLAKSTNWGFIQYNLKHLRNGFLSRAVLEKLIENRRLISFILEKIVVNGSGLKKAQKLDSKSLENALSLIVNSGTKLEIDAGWRDFNLEHFAYTDRIRKLRCCVGDKLGLTGLICCSALKDLCLISPAEPSVKVLEWNTSLDELVSLTLNGLNLNWRPSSCNGQLPSFLSLRVLSVDIRMFNLPDDQHTNYSMSAILSKLFSNCPKIEQESLFDETYVHSVDSHMQNF